jgi:ATP-dependent helicase/nuclease subunit A
LPVKAQGLQVLERTWFIHLKYTKSQQSVIDIRGKNILVSAAAGSGKTAVLVERIIKMVSDADNPVDIDRLLVLTFTNLAAGEMRERIGQAIGRKLEQDPENTHLQRQMTLLHNAQITTIDSFCLFVLRNHFHGIGLDPGFRVADEGELRLLKKEVLADLLEAWYESKNPDFLNCVEYFTTGSNDRDLEEYIEKLFTMSMSFPWPEEWLLERKADYMADPGAAAHIGRYPWMEYLLAYAGNIIAGGISELEGALRICAQADGPYMYSELLEKELQMLFNLLPDGASAKSADYNDFLAKWGAITFARLPAKKDDAVSAAKREQVKKIRVLVKDAVNETGEKFFRHSPAKIMAIIAVFLMGLTSAARRR